MTATTAVRAIYEVLGTLQWATIFSTSEQREEIQEKTKRLTTFLEELANVVKPSDLESGSMYFLSTVMVHWDVRHVFGRVGYVIDALYQYLSDSGFLEGIEQTQSAILPASLVFLGYSIVDIVCDCSSEDLSALEQLKETNIRNTLSDAEYRTITGKAEHAAMAWKLGLFIYEHNRFRQYTSVTCGKRKPKNWKRVKLALYSAIDELGVFEDNPKLIKRIKTPLRRYCTAIPKLIADDRGAHSGALLIVALDVLQQAASIEVIKPNFFVEIVVQGRFVSNGDWHKLAEQFAEKTELSRRPDILTDAYSFASILVARIGDAIERSSCGALCCY